MNHSSHCASALVLFLGFTVLQGASFSPAWCQPAEPGEEVLVRIVFSGMIGLVKEEGALIALVPDLREGHSFNGCPSPPHRPSFGWVANCRGDACTLDREIQKAVAAIASLERDPPSPSDGQVNAMSIPGPTVTMPGQWVLNEEIIELRWEGSEGDEPLRYQEAPPDDPVRELPTHGNSSAFSWVASLGAIGSHAGKARGAFRNPEALTKSGLAAWMRLEGGVAKTCSFATLLDTVTVDRDKPWCGAKVQLQENSIPLLEFLVEGNSGLLQEFEGRKLYKRALADQVVVDLLVNTTGTDEPMVTVTRREFGEECGPTTPCPTIELSAVPSARCQRDPGGEMMACMVLLLGNTMAGDAPFHPRGRHFHHYWEIADGMPESVPIPVAHHQEWTGDQKTASIAIEGWCRYPEGFEESEGIRFRVGVPAPEDGPICPVGSYSGWSMEE